jgi:5-methyltetrahydrofolate--homocysteine methyltransferase
MNLGLFQEKVLFGDREGVEALAREAISEGISVGSIINEHLMPAMAEVGRRYEEGELFIPEMIIAGQAMQAGMAVLKPLIVGSEVVSAGRVVIGTVEGDIHDIGKSLVSMMLEGAGFEVYDLGVDVKPEKFVEAVRDRNATLVAMSAMLTSTLAGMKQTIVALQEAGMRDRVLVLVGGAPLTDAYAASIGADAYAEDAAAGVRKAKELLAGASTRLG